MVEPKARPLSIKARVRIDYFPINTDLDSDYSYYTPNGAVVTAENSNISNNIITYSPRTG